MKIASPTLLVDEETCRANIGKMKSRAQKAKAVLRPHFKTHQSAEIAAWFKDAGIEQCTVSSVSMAKYFASHGWKDLSIAFPYNPLEADAVNELAADLNLNIWIESEESLTEVKSKIKNPIGYFIGIDVGYHRTGIDPRQLDKIARLVGQQSENHIFKGFMSHAGHTYGAKGAENIRWLYEGAKKMLLPLRDKFGGIVSFGDTPSCSIIEDLSDYDELRPGNFIFYDWMQHDLASCKVEEIAVCLACPVVAIHPDRNEVIVQAGAVHLSKDYIEEEAGKTFGKAVRLDSSGWSRQIMGNVVRLSQEHGTIRLEDPELASVKIGDLLGIIPVHSCLAADLQGHYISTKGEKIEKLIKS
ncbi:MAG: alanine racemase [Bacteroidota bacterium]